MAKKGLERCQAKGAITSERVEGFEQLSHVVQRGETGRES